MKLKNIVWMMVLVLTVAVTGCTKKTADEASLSGTGFDSMATSEELSQLSQAGQSNQQNLVEALPIEVAPVTQAVVPADVIPAATEALATASSSLSQDEKIQTALKNAGFYNGNIDGKIGPASKKAIEDFQTSQGLKVDGKVGPKTWAALEAYLNGTAPASNTAQ